MLVAISIEFVQLVDHVREPLGPVFPTAITVTMNKRRRDSTTNKRVKVQLAYDFPLGASTNASLWAKS